MNNLRLLAGLLLSVLPGGVVCSYAQTTISLEEIFETADRNSTKLRPSFSAQEESLNEINVARNGYLPDINASLSISYIGDGFTTKRNFTDFQKAPIPHLGTGLALNLTQPIYTGNAISGAVDLAKLKSTASRYSTELRRDNLRFQITGFYLDLYRYFTLRSVVESNIEAAHKVLEDMQARYKQGIALRNDITRYELLVSNLELQLTRINNTIEIFNDNLVTMAGLTRGTRIIPDSTILQRSLPLEGEAMWQQEAETGSPAIALARNAVEINRKTDVITRSERLPKIGIQAGWTIDGPILVEVPPINRNLSYWYVGVGVSYNLSSLYKTDKSIRKSRISIRRSEEELEATRENVAMAVRNDHIRYLEAYEEMKTQQKSVELANRNYHTTFTRYSADMALITDMLDAANSRLEAQQQLVNSRINIIYYYYKLLFISGKI